MVSLGATVASILLRRERLLTTGQVRKFTELAPLILIRLMAVAVMLGATSAVRYILFGPGSLPAWR